MKKTFYLMRHGQTLFNVRRKIQGACDSPLTKLGIQQAKEASEYFKDIPLDHAYSSTSERACDTLELATNYQMPYKRLKGLKEMNYGVFEGESEDLHPQDNKVYGTFYLDYSGESRAQVRERMVKICTEMMEIEDHQTVLAVSHAGACYQFLGHWQDPADELKKGFPNCCIFKYEFDSVEKVFSLLEVIRPTIGVETVK